MTRFVANFDMPFNEVADNVYMASLGRLKQRSDAASALAVDIRPSIEQYTCDSQMSISAGDGESCLPTLWTFKVQIGCRRSSDKIPDFGSLYQNRQIYTATPREVNASALNCLQYTNI